MDRLAHILNRNNGFTFIEVSISIVVLSLALLAMAGMQVIALRGNSFASQISQGAAIAEDIVESLTVLNVNHPNFDDLTPVGLFTTYHEPNTPKGYSAHWHVDANFPAPQSKTINVNVIWHTSIGAKNFSLSFVKN